MVTLRIHKPRDSNSLSLTQICLLGYPGLTEPGALPQHMNSSLSWLELLYHCINHIPGVKEPVLNAVEQQQDQIGRASCRERV